MSHFGKSDGDVDATFLLMLRYDILLEKGSRAKWTPFTVIVDDDLT
jgi:hypothetical protein